MITPFTPEHIVPELSSSEKKKKRGVAKATTTASGGGADDQPKKAKKVSDVKVTAMMESARAEMENQQRKRDAMDIYERCQGNHDISLLCKTVIQRHDRSTCTRTWLHRNIRGVGTFQEWLIDETLQACLPDELCTDDNSVLAAMSKSDKQDLFKLLTNWQDATNLPGRELRICTVVLLCGMRILNQPNFITIVMVLMRLQRNNVCKAMNFNHEIGRYRMGPATVMIADVPFFNTITHVASAVTKTLPLSMHIPKGSTYGKKPEFIIDRNSSSGSARLVQTGGSMVPLGPLFREDAGSEFEEVVDLMAAAEEYKVLDAMASAEDFNIKQHLTGKLEQVMKSHEDPCLEKDARKSMQSSFEKTFLPSLQKSPKKRLRLVAEATSDDDKTSMSCSPMVQSPASADPQSPEPTARMKSLLSPSKSPEPPAVVVHSTDDAPSGQVHPSSAEALVEKSTNEVEKDSTEEENKSSEVDEDLGLPGI